MCWGHKEGCSPMLVRHRGETSANLWRNRPYKCSWKCRMHRGRVLVLLLCSLFWFEAVPRCKRGGQRWHLMQTAPAHCCLAWWPVFCLSARSCSHSNKHLIFYSLAFFTLPGCLHCSIHAIWPHLYCKEVKMDCAMFWGQHQAPITASILYVSQNVLLALKGFQLLIWLGIS